LIIYYDFLWGNFLKKVSPKPPSKTLTQKNERSEVFYKSFEGARGNFFKSFPEKVFPEKKQKNFFSFVKKFIFLFYH